MDELGTVEIFEIIRPRQTQDRNEDANRDQHWIDEGVIAAGFGQPAGEQKDPDGQREPEQRTGRQKHPEPVTHCRALQKAAGQG